MSRPAAGRKAEWLFSYSTASGWGLETVYAWSLGEAVEIVRGRVSEQALDLALSSYRGPSSSVFTERARLPQDLRDLCEMYAV